MPYRIEVVHEGRYLHLRVVGENSAQTVASYLAEMSELCLEKGVDSLLIEEHLTGPSLDPLEVYQVSSTSVEGFSVKRAAYVDTAPGHDSSLMEFAETVAVNRGGTVRLFATVEEARIWLEKEIEAESAGG